MNRNSTECAAEYATKCGAGNMAKNSAAYAVKSGILSAKGKKVCREL